MFSLPKTSLLCGALGALLTLGACGAPDYCEDTGPKGFSTFRTQNWEPYCQEMEARLSEPLNYELTDLTDTFSAYPERAAGITEQLGGYAEPDRCFESKRDQIELRRLRSCLEVDEDKEARIKKAWDIRAKPWIAQYEEKIKALKLALDDLDLEATRVDEKVTQKFDLSATMEPDMVHDISLKLDELQPKIAEVDKAQLDYERFLATSMANPSLNAFIEETYDPTIQELLKKHEVNRFAIAKLRGTERYFRYAASSVGWTCQPGPKATKEKRIVKPLLRSAMSEAKASKLIHVTTPIAATKDPNTGADVETIKGYFCGERDEGNQFEGKPRLCVPRHFEIMRDRPPGERKWTSWRVIETREGELNEGVDCALLHKK